jgi:hypothetical protein
MARGMKRWTAVLFVVTAAATVVALTAQGRDDDKRVAGFYKCDILNENPSGPQWADSNCIEGHECLVCEDWAGFVGLYVAPNGNGPKVWDGDPVPCDGPSSTVTDFP